LSFPYTIEPDGERSKRELYQRQVQVSPKPLEVFHFMDFDAVNLLHCERKYHNQVDKSTDRAKRIQTAL
jgi:hypothetical protein